MSNTLYIQTAWSILWEERELGKTSASLVWTTWRRNIVGRRWTLLQTFRNVSHLWPMWWRQRCEQTWLKRAKTLSLGCTPLYPIVKAKMRAIITNISFAMCALLIKKSNFLIAQSKLALFKLRLTSIDYSLAYITLIWNHNYNDQFSKLCIIEAYYIEEEDKVLIWKVEAGLLSYIIYSCEDVQLYFHGRIGSLSVACSRRNNR